jgi:leader peptidase (prepilin peptidase)/N-methyltransferase
MAWHGLLQQHPWLLYFATLLVGLIVGSFLNVLIYRLPRIMERKWRGECAEVLGHAEENGSMERFDLVRPGSRCPHCGHKIRIWENIPLLSYLLLRGRCSACDTPISLRYPVIEAATAALSVIVVGELGLSWAGASALLLTWSLIALAAIDLDTTLLPDAITLPVLWLGLLLSLAGLFTEPQSAIIGAAFGYLSLWSLYHLFRLITGKEGMGYGDFKLFALFGAWLGWQQLPQIIILSSLVGAVIGMALILLRGHDRNVPIPFGPYLAAAGWISLVWGDELNRLYLAWFGLG